MATDTAVKRHGCFAHFTRWWQISLSFGCHQLVMSDSLHLCTNLLQRGVYVPIILHSMLDKPPKIFDRQQIFRRSLSTLLFPVQQSSRVNRRRIPSKSRLTLCIRIARNNGLSCLAHHFCTCLVSCSPVAHSNLIIALNRRNFQRFLVTFNGYCQSGLRLMQQFRCATIPFEYNLSLIRLASSQTICEQ